MIKGVYQTLARMRDQPVSAWEAMRDACQNPKERAHYDIAIRARKVMEGSRETQANP